MEGANFAGRARLRAAPQPPLAGWPRPLQHVATAAMADLGRLSARVDAIPRAADPVSRLGA
jgi:hypothetical protein